MKKRMSSALFKMIPFLFFSLMLVFLLSWTFVPYLQENAARHDFTDYTILVKNDALKEAFPDSFMDLAWQPSEEERDWILAFLRQLKPVQTDDFNQSADLFVLTDRDPQGVILYHDAYLYRVCTAGKSYQGQPLLIIYKQSIDGQTLKLKESVYYRSEQDVDAWMDNLAMIRGQVVEYPY